MQQKPPKKKNGALMRFLEFSKKIIIWNTVIYFLIIIGCMWMISMRPSIAEYAKFIFSTSSTLYGSIVLMYTGKSAIENFNKIRGDTQIERDTINNGVV